MLIIRWLYLKKSYRVPYSKRWRLQIDIWQSLSA